MKIEKNVSRLLLIAAGCALGCAQTASAQAVVFPQQQQAGIASASESNGVYTLSNDLLSAGFAIVDGKLKFNGCEALGLKPGSELFAVTLGNNTTFTSSEMAMSEVRTVGLTDNPSAARGSEHIPGHATLKPLLPKMTSRWFGARCFATAPITCARSLSSRARPKLRWPALLR